MAATAKPDVSTVWASGGAATPIPKAKQATGWGEEIPEYDDFNGMVQQLSQYQTHIDEQGIGVWAATTNYALNGWARGSDGVVYISRTADNKGNSPTGTNGANFWRSLADYIASLTQGRLLNIQAFPADGTYKKTPGTKRIKVRLVGGGGAGGSGNAPGVPARRGGGGAAGGYVEALQTLADTDDNLPVVVGKGGTPTAGTAANSTGNPGGSTTFNGLVGGGGRGGVNNNGSNSAAGGLGGNAVGGYYNSQGGDGSDGPVQQNSDPSGGSGDGGASGFGGGGRGGQGIGYAGRAPGSGGGGGVNIAAAGAGADGLVIIEEYS